MRPILLTFAGLRSYRAPVEIDFTDLDLFAVIGDTGAGKSTILEALSLALYAKKTWKGGGSHLDDMIADGEQMLRVELTFAAADHEWRVTRTRRRGTGANVSKLVCLTAAERVDGAVAVTDRVTQLIGLDHGQFTRAVVMPQGRFDELLRATPSERGKLLGSILGLDDVRAVGRAADALAGRWREPLVAARTRRAGLPADPAAALAAAEVEVARAASRLTALQAAIERAAAAEGRAASVRVARDRLGAAQAAVPAGDGADAVATLRAAHAAGVALHRVRDEAVAARDLAVAEVAAVDEQATAALAGFAGRDAAVVAGGALRRSAADLAEATAMGDETQDRLAALDASPPAAAVPAVLVTGRAAAAADRDRARAATADAAAAVAVARSAWTELAVVHRRADDAAAAIAAAGERVTAAAATAAAAEATAAATATGADAADAAYRSAATADAAAVAAQHCGPGEPCPVCARPLPGDFMPPASADLDTAERDRRSAAAAAAAARDDRSRAIADLAHARMAAAAATALAETETEALAAAWAAAAEAGADPDAADVEAAVAGLEGARESAAAVAAGADRAHATAHDAVTAATAAAEAAVASHRRDRIAAAEVAADAERRVAALVAAAADLPPAWRPAGAVTAAVLADVAAKVETVLAALDALDVRRRRAEADQASAVATVNRTDVEAHEQVTQPVQQALGELAARWGRIADVGAAVDAAATAVAMGDGLRRAPVLPPVPARATISQLPDTIDAAVAALAATETVVTVGRDSADALRARHDALVAESAHALGGVGEPDVAAARQASGVAHAGAAAARTDAERAQDAVETAAVLDRFLAVARPFVANLEVLVVAMRDQHFLGYLVKARESELLAEATRRLRAITDGRFGFVTDFGVVSIASGEVRTPDTLSGGERFQAALALALALVEIASRGGGRLDAVFVDEGFGSLDTAALATALDTLGTVAGGGKMVALISHLRPVADYVETVLHVTKDDVLGSRITRLDPDARDRLLADDIRSGLTA